MRKRVGDGSTWSAKTSGLVKLYGDATAVGITEGVTVGIADGTFLEVTLGEVGGATGGTTEGSLAESVKDLKLAAG